MSSKGDVDIAHQSRCSPEEQTELEPPGNPGHVLGPAPAFLNLLKHVSFLSMSVYVASWFGYQPQNPAMKQNWLGSAPVADVATS